VCPASAAPPGLDVPDRITASTEHTVTAVVPLAELFGYATQLRSRTHGRGTFSTRPAGYRPAA